MTLAASVKRNYFPTILILLHIVIFLYKISIGQFFLIDSYEYYQLAKNILNQGVFYHEDLKALPLIPEAYTRRPPLYSLFIIFSSLFFTSDIAILIFQNICSVLSILGIKKIFENEGYFVSKNLFLIVLITSLNQFIYTNLIMSEILFQFLIVLIIFFAQKALKNRSLHHFIATQLVLVLLFLTKPVFYLFLIPNLFLSFLFLKKTKLKKIYLFYSFIPIIVLFFYCFWNFQRTENFEMSSLQNHNLIDWNLKSFHVHAYGSSVADSINHEIQTTASSIISYPVKQEFYKTQVINYIKKDWFAYSLFHLIGSVRCFVDPGRFDLYSFFDIETNMSFMNIMNRGDIRLLWNLLPQIPVAILLIMIIMFIFNCLKFLCLCWFWIRPNKKPSATVYFSFFILLYIVILTGPLGASRFMVPVLPIYLIMAVIGGWDLMNKIRNYERKTSLTLPSS